MSNCAIVYDEFSVSNGGDKIISEEVIICAKYRTITSIIKSVLKLELKANKV